MQLLAIDKHEFKIFITTINLFLLHSNSLSNNKPNTFVDIVIYYQSTIYNLDKTN